MAINKIAVIVGSLRKESFSRKMANTLIETAPGNLKMEIVEIGALQMYNEDLDLNPPAEYTEFRNKIKRYDGLLFITPEYNRSVPAVLKNALDVGSRPYGQNVWNGKPGAVMSVSIGGIGGFGANHHLRQTLVVLNIPTMPQPEAYIGNIAELFDDKGRLISESVRGYISKFMKAYEVWIGTNVKRH